MAWAVSLRDIRTEIKQREGLTRCVIELSGETVFYQRDFLADKKYFLVDIYNISPAVAQRFITPATGPVRQILVLNRKDPDTRVLTLVFYLTDLRQYRVFSVKEPFRIVVDVTHGLPEGPAQPGSQTSPIGAPVVAPGAARSGVLGSNVPFRPSPAVTPPTARQAMEPYRKPGKKIVVLDPGHGGSDPGAESYLRLGGEKVQEKDLNLRVALEVKRLLDASPNMEAFLTRGSDRYVSLADRQSFCDRRSPRIAGDLFISIHCNASDSWRTRGARGIEFYYLDPTGTARGALRYLEEIENRNGGKGEDNGPNWDHPIFRTLARESLIKWLTEGKIVCEHLRAASSQIPYFRRYANREVPVQGAFFRVLFQADMPAVLVELGFLTNTEECRQLADPKFQKQIATTLYNGIAAYFKARDERFEPKYLTLQLSP